MSGVRLPRPTVREDFRKRLRAGLMNEAVALAEERRLRRRSLGERLLTFTTVRLRPTLVAATIVAVLLAGAGAAAAGSLPGDPAFGLKRAAEEVELAFAPNDGARVEVLAAQAGRRLAELARTTARPDKAPTASAEYEAAVKRLAASVAALRAAQPGSKHDAVEQIVDAAREKHVPVLEELKQRLPAEAQRGIDRAILEHEKLQPSAKPGERGPRPGERPGTAPRKSDEPERTAAPGRASETPRGGRPQASPTPRR